MPPTPVEVATAYHEAGHAVIALALGRPVKRVSVQPNQLRLGRCELQKGTFKPSDDVVETEILILLGGPAAEARRTGRYCWDAGAEDLRGVRSMTRMRGGSERQVERLERRMLDKTEYLLDRPGAWAAIEKIAAELLEKTTISGRAARHLYNVALAQAARAK